MTMEKHDRKKNDQNRSEILRDDNDLSGQRSVVDNAREEAMEDIEEDLELGSNSPEDDLDEGESARLGDDRTDLV